MSGFDLFDALDDSNNKPGSGSNQSTSQGQPAGTGPWGSGGGPWGSSGDQSGGGGPWPSQASGGGGVWPGGGTNPTPGGWSNPQPTPTPEPGPARGGGPGPGSGSSARQNPSVPFRMSLRSGAFDGMLIAIKGVIKPNANRITMDMCTQTDIAFHFNPRFNEGGQKVIVRNSCQRKKWGKEERQLPRFPFVPGKPFEMEILCTSSEFKVSVNGSQLLTFRHRVTDLRSINAFCIYYDLDLISVEQRTS